MVTSRGQELGLMNLHQPAGSSVPLPSQILNTTSFWESICSVGSHSGMGWEERGACTHDNTRDGASIYTPFRAGWLIKSNLSCPAPASSRGSKTTRAIRQSVTLQPRIDLYILLAHRVDFGTRGQLRRCFLDCFSMWPISRYSPFPIRRPFVYNMVQVPPSSRVLLIILYRPRSCF